MSTPSIPSPDHHTSLHPFILSAFQLALHTSYYSTLLTVLRLSRSFLRGGNFITNFSFALGVGDVPVEDLVVVLALDAPGELLVLELQLLTDQEYLGHVGSHVRRYSHQCWQTTECGEAESNSVTC